MAFTLLARCSGTVVASGDRPGTFVGTVENSEPRATFVGTVSLGRVAAYNATCIRTGFRIKLNGVELPDEDLVGYSLKENVDSSVTFLDFTVVGSAYSVLGNRETWTLTPVELWVVNGPPGAERDELKFTGWVRTGDEQGSGAGDLRSGNGMGGATMRISCVDGLGKFSEFALCHEIEPLAGMTRGAIVTELCADAGLTAVDVPDGAVYTKGIQAKNTKLLEFLRPFGEPEGWKFRWRPEPFTGTPGALTGGGVLEAWTPTLRLAPLAADDVWDLSRSASIRIEPPRDVPSRWVIRGYGAVFVDEMGQETKTQTTEVWDLYAPKVAINEQDSAGVITPTGYSPLAASLRLVQRIVDTTVSRGGKVLSRESTEWGWYNPRVAKAVTDTGSGGYAYLAALIDEEGEFVRYAQESFVQVSNNRVLYAYDVDGNAVGATEELSRFYRRTKGVMSPNDAGTTVVGAYVYGDEGSYSTDVELYGLAESHLTTRTFNDDTGAEAQVVVKSYGYVSPRSAIGPITWLGGYVRSNGLGQIDIVADWQQYAETTVRNIIADGTLQGTIELSKKLDTARILKDFGAYQWGEYDSNSTSETLMASGIKRVQYNTLSTETFERVTREVGKPPVREIVSGRVPQPRYKASAWTYLAQEPIELIVDDPVVEELLGFRREVAQNDHVQSLAEAERVITARRGRALSYRVEVSRNESHLALGSTVFLKHPDHALARRALMVEAATARSRPKASQTGTYLFEVPL